MFGSVPLSLIWMRAKKDIRFNEATVKYLLMRGPSSSILVCGFSSFHGGSFGEVSELQEMVY